MRLYNTVKYSSTCFLCSPKAFRLRPPIILACRTQYSIYHVTTRAESHKMLGFSKEIIGARQMPLLTSPQLIIPAHQIVHARTLLCSASAEYSVYRIQ